MIVLLRLLTRPGTYKCSEISVLGIRDRALICALLLRVCFEPSFPRVAEWYSNRIPVYTQPTTIPPSFCCNRSLQDRATLFALGFARRLGTGAEHGTVAGSVEKGEEDGA